MNDAYYKGYKQGYVAGYRDGVEDHSRGMPKDNADDIQQLPVEGMKISNRARNCLRMMGCRYVSDVIVLSENTLKTAIKLGPVTGREVAAWLDENGLPYTAWNRYL